MATGFPVKVAFDFRHRCPFAPGSPRQTLRAKRLPALLVSPGKLFCSHKTTGLRVSHPAIIAGPAT